MFKFQSYLVPAAILAFSWLLFCFEPVSQQWLAYQHSSIEEYQYWRLLSANLLHTNFQHLLMNSAGLVLLSLLHGRYYQISTYLSCFSLSALFTTLGIYLFVPDMLWYVGLSGALHGIFIWGAYTDIRNKILGGWLLILGLWIKIGYEQIYGASATTAELINAEVAIDAHLFGALGGLTFVLCDWLINLHKKRA